MPRKVLALTVPWLWACAMSSSVDFTAYSTEVELIRYESANSIEYRVPQGLREPLPATSYTGWFVPSRWVERLAERFEGLPDSFDPRGAEYCCVIFVDENRMVHASSPVRWTNSFAARRTCPPLGAGAGERGTKQVGITHQHQDGTGPSDVDLNLASAMFIGGKLIYTGAVVELLTGRMLSGTDPETGRPAAVPAQHFLIARHRGELYVVMWVRCPHPRSDRPGAVTVYVPARDGTDNWRRASECWINPDAQSREAGGTVLPALCEPANIWQSNRPPP